jgi:aqualysin 1
VVKSDIFEYIEPFIDDILSGKNPFDRLISGVGSSPQRRDTENWGLDRINQRRLPLDGNGYGGPYTGQGVDVFVLDSGIRPTHSEFRSNDGTTTRASCSLNVVDKTSSTCPDGTGHGTHVAAIIGGRTYGVAPSARIRSVKVLDEKGFGVASWVMEALEHVIQQAAASSRPIVVNLSLGARDSAALNQAVDAAASVGIIVVASAGNEGINSCLKAPAGSTMAITVGAIADNDLASSYSNYGECVDIFAPGTDIISASNVDDDRSRSFTGTSQAAPHVTGVAALLLEQDPTRTPAAVWEKMKADATNDQLSLGGLFNNHNNQGSPNRLVMTP